MTLTTAHHRADRRTPRARAGRRQRPKHASAAERRDQSRRHHESAERDRAHRCAHSPEPPRTGVHRGVMLHRDRSDATPFAETTRPYGSPHCARPSLGPDEEGLRPFGLRRRSHPAVVPPRTPRPRGTNQKGTHHEHHHPRRPTRHRPRLEPPTATPSAPSGSPSTEAAPKAPTSSPSSASAPPPNNTTSTSPRADSSRSPDASPTPSGPTKTPASPESGTTRGSLELAGQLPRMSVPETIAAVREAAHGLARTHDGGIVHRDVKSPHLFWSHPALVSSRRLRVCASSGQERRGSRRRNAGDRCAGAPGRRPVDRTLRHPWSLGATAYHLLTGIYPYEDIAPTRSRSDLDAARAAGPPTPVRRLAPHVSQRIASRVERALVERSSDRYPSMTAFESDLGAGAAPSRSWRHRALQTLGTCGVGSARSRPNSGFVSLRARPSHV